jgi:hypothetical protein
MQDAFLKWLIFRFNSIQETTHSNYLKANHAVDSSPNDKTNVKSAFSICKFN